MLGSSTSYFDGRRTDGIEQAVDGKVLFLTRKDVLDTEVVQEVAITLAFRSSRIPEDSLGISLSRVIDKRRIKTHDLGVVQETLCHDFGSAEFGTADEDVDMRAILC